MQHRMIQIRKAMSKYSKMHDRLFLHELYHCPYQFHQQLETESITSKKKKTSWRHMHIRLQNQTSDQGQKTQEHSELQLFLLDAAREWYNFIPVIYNLQLELSLEQWFLRLWGLELMKTKSHRIKLSSSFLVFVASAADPFIWHQNIGYFTWVLTQLPTK